MLKLTDVHAGYGATPILFGVSLEVRAGEAVALLGRNGMGKTTLLKTAIGFLAPWRGAIEFEGVDLMRRAPHEIARLGVGFVPENRRIFPGLTVRENLELGLSAAPDRSAAIDGADSTRCSTTSRACASASSSPARRSPAASSRCWRSPAS